MGCPQRPAWYTDYLNLCEIDLEAAMVAVNTRTRTANRKKAVVDGALSALAGVAAAAPAAVAGATAVTAGVLFAPVLLVVGVSIPLLRAEWLKSAEQGTQRTYHTVRQIAKEAERTIRGLYYTPGTDPKWNQVCQQVTTMRTLIIVLDNAGA